MTGITILIPLGRFFDNIIDVDYWIHAVTYVLVQHWYKPCEPQTLNEQNAPTLKFHQMKACVWIIS